jgi:hypothetical protein
MTAAVSWLMFLGQAVAGQVQGPTTAPAFDPYEHVTVEIHPMAPPVPALRYRLMPEVSDQIDGNAATQYLLTLELMPEIDFAEWSGLLEAPQLDKAKSAALLVNSSGKFHQAELASRMNRCDWGLPLGEEGPIVLLPHINHLRPFSVALALQIRLEIADAKYDGAVTDLRTGFTMAHHLSEQGLLVPGLVSNSFNAMFLQRVAELQQAHDAPNLYWALANLPHPLIDQRRIVEIERNLILARFPELRGRTIEQLDDNDYRILFRRMAEVQHFPGAFPTGAREQISVGSAEFASAMVSVYEQAKSRLIERGQTAEQIDRMPVQTVLGTYLLGDYLKWTDELDKWAGLPYWQAHEGMLRSKQALHEQIDLRNNPLMELAPNFDRALLQFARVQRMEVEVQCIEALRAFAAAHGGKLPATLDELVDTPVPVDPMTGKPLGYEAHGVSATLTSEPLPGEMKFSSGRITQIVVK